MLVGKYHSSSLCKLSNACIIIILLLGLCTLFMDSSLFHHIEILAQLVRLHFVLFVLINETSCKMQFIE